VCVCVCETNKKYIAAYRGFGDHVRFYQEVADLFNAIHPDRNISKLISKFIVQKKMTHFFEAETVKDRSCNGKPKSMITNDDKSLNVLQLFLENPYLSVARAAQAHNVSQGNIFNIKKK